MRRGRPLKPAEARLWATVTAAIRPLAPLRLSADPLPSPPEVEPSDPPTPPPKPASKRVPGPPPRPPTPPRPAAKPLVPLDPKTRRAVARGRIRPEATLDLHGMRQDEAHAALNGFLLHAQRSGLRLVTVVTGKGRAGLDGEGERGVLRRLVPHWLAMPALRPAVLGWTESAPHRGGSGALLVRLRAGRGGA